MRTDLSGIQVIVKPDRSRRFYAIDFMLDTEDKVDLLPSALS